MYVCVCVRAGARYVDLRVGLFCVRTVVTIPAGGASKQRWYDARLTRLDMGIGNPIYRTFFPPDTLFRFVSLSLSLSLCFSFSRSFARSLSLSVSFFRSLSCGTRANGLLDLRTFLTTISCCTDVFIRVMGIYAKPTKARSLRDLRERSRAKSSFCNIDDSG